MMAAPPVFLADRARLAADSLVLDGAEGRHAATVRRLRAGERVDLTDGAGLLAACVVRAAGRGHLLLDVLSRREIPRPAPRVTVAQALVKGDRGELAVELMTEVGVDVIVPWVADRCVVRWQGERGAKALARWRSTAREAAKQSRRCWLPEVTEPVTTAGLLARVAGAARVIALDQAAQAPLAGLEVPDAGEVVAVVGPEGGITDAELRALDDAGAIRARLGPTVLRTSTAGAAAAVLLLARAGRW